MLRNMLQPLVFFICLCNFQALLATNLIVGIAGGTGSGKTTLAQYLVDELKDKAVIINQDSYYYDLSHLSSAEKKTKNFDHPNAIDFNLLGQHIALLKQGLPIEQPMYDFITCTRKKETISVQPSSIIIFEGILLLAVPAIRDLLDVKIFVEVDDDLRLLRRLDRDMQERGKSFEETKVQYLATVRPMHQAFVEPSKKYADLIFPAERQNKQGIQMLLSMLGTVK